MSTLKTWSINFGIIATVLGWFLGGVWLIAQGIYFNHPFQGWFGAFMVVALMATGTTILE